MNRKRVYRLTILHRPKHIQKRLEPAHWETDTMRGKRSQPRYVLPSVERRSRYTRLAVLLEPNAEVTAKALSRSLRSFKVRSITV